MKAKILREKRIYMRTTPQERKLLEKAVKVAGLSSLTSFILIAAKREAERIIALKNVRTLPLSDQLIVMDALQNPPEPNAHLQQLLAPRKRVFKIAD